MGGTNVGYKLLQLIIIVSFLINRLSIADYSRLGRRQED